MKRVLAIKVIDTGLGCGTIYEHEIPVQYEWFLLTVLKMAETFAKKNHDYSGGQSGSWLNNFRGGGLRGIFNRMDDKFNRLMTFLKGNKLKNEPFEDACLDLAVYALILMKAQQEKLSTQGEYWEKSK